MEEVRYEQGRSSSPCRRRQTSNKKTSEVRSRKHASDSSVLATLKRSFFGALVVCAILVVFRNNVSGSNISQKPRMEKTSKSFVVDYKNNQFVKDGSPYRYIAGAIHYFRIPKIYWADRLLKMKAAGLDAIQVYVPWNLHEPRSGQELNFDGNADLVTFIKTAQTMELDVILRPGPYICSEWDMGGLPWWLLKEKNIKLRTAQPLYIHYVQRWLSKLLPLIRPYLYSNGGPIIMVQVENEYGSFPACDHAYMQKLVDIFHIHLGKDNVVLFTTDGAIPGKYLKCGSTKGMRIQHLTEVKHASEAYDNTTVNTQHPVRSAKLRTVGLGAYPTVDFGTKSRKGTEIAFSVQRKYAPQGPLVNSEFYPGWFDFWGKNHSRQSPGQILDTMKYMWEMNASFTFYMFTGGTNFGHMNGASVTTSYDYDAPISEAGDPTEKLFAIQRQIAKLKGKNSTIPMPPAQPKIKYGKVVATFYTEVTTAVKATCPMGRFYKVPPTFEELDFPYGFVLYTTVVPFKGNSLSAPGLRDRAYVMVDGQTQAVLSANDHVEAVNVFIAPNSSLDILVENLGRKFSGVIDRKGLLGGVLLDGKKVVNWKACPVDMEQIFRGITGNGTIIKTKSRNHKASKKLFIPSIYYARFETHVHHDTFFHPNGWKKGQLYMNHFDVGRYWPALGPQVTLYVPKSVVREETEILIMETEGAGACQDDGQSECLVLFIEHPILNKSVVPAHRK